jgi:hypothetical protein
VRAFETAVVDVTLLKEGYGTLVIGLEPVTAAVAIDGVAAGSGPMTIDEIGVGSHEVVLTADGYVTVAKTTDIVADQVVRLDVKLDPLPPAVARGRGGSGPPIVRLAIDGATGLGGLAFGAASVWEYVQGRKAYRDYVLVIDDTAAEAFFQAYVVPYRTKALAFGITGAALTGASVALFATTDFTLDAGPSGMRLRGRW